MFKYYSNKIFFAFLIIGFFFMLPAANAQSVLYTNDFSSGDLTGWAFMGIGANWTLTDEVLQGSGDAYQYSYAYYDATWTNYTVEGSVMVPAGSFGGGIGGRVDPITGAHYGAWIYPEGSLGGSNVLQLCKFQTWTDIPPDILASAALSDVAGNFHTLTMTFLGNQILVYTDENSDPAIDVTDNDSPYVSGGISFDWFSLIKHLTSQLTIFWLQMLLQRISPRFLF